MSSKYSNLLPRVLVAIVGIPLILAASYVGGIWFLLFVMLIGVFGILEYVNLAKLKGANPQTFTAITGFIALALSFFHEQIQNFVIPFFIRDGGISFLQKLQLFITVMFIFLILVLVIELFRNKGSVFLNAGYTIFGVVYIGLFLSSLIGIRELFGAEFPYHLIKEIAASQPEDQFGSITYTWGGITIISILASIWMSDTAAYFGGISMGRHKLLPRVSPGKSWEGAVWGFVGAVSTIIFFQQYFLPYLKLHHAVIIGIIIGVFGQIGDLVESLLKRDAGVKDSSHILPGHGGILDRFDSLIFVSPILYLYIDFVVLS